MKTLRLLLLSGSVLATLIFAGCADTEVRKTWTAPAVGSLKFSKVCIIAIARDDTDRRLAEIAVKDLITRVPTVASYELFPDISDMKDKAKVIKAVKESGADGVIVMSMTSSDTKVEAGASSARPMEYMVFSDYYGSVYDAGAFYSQDRRDMATTSIFDVETRIFDGKTGKLVWVGNTKTTKDSFHDRDTRGNVTEVAESIRAALKSQDLIP